MRKNIKRQREIKERKKEALGSGFGGKGEEEHSMSQSSIMTVFSCIKTYPDKCMRILMLVDELKTL